MRWRAAMSAALYGPDGFFVRPDAGPAGHFRTSANASPAFAGAVLRLVESVDAALGRPEPLDLVDVGAGRGELLRALLGLAPPALAGRLRAVAVELAPRPAELPPAIGWTGAIPDGVTGVLLATEWLDNVPLDVACRDEAGVLRYVLVDPATGAESAGPPVTGPDAAWLDRWWPGAGWPPLYGAGWPASSGAGWPASSGAGWPASSGAGWRAEVGLPRDEAWAAAVASVRRGLALAVDYGHRRGDRPPAGSLTGYRGGRQVPPVPDGSRDLTAHVAIDSAAEAGGSPYTLVSQRTALRALGVDGGRPPLALASTDPAGYLRALARASAAAELTDPTGLGSHWWLLHPVGIDIPPPLPRGG
jgi:SAM-dependent MidA family methyltransferase